MDIKIAGSKNRTFIIQNRDRFVIFRSVIGHKDGGLTANDGFYCTGDFFLVRKLDRDTIANSQSIGLDVHSHVSVQRDQCQRTVFIHHIRNGSSGFTEDRLHPTGDTGIDGGTGRIVFCIAELLVQIFNLGLQVCHCADHRCHIHRCQNIALDDCLVGFHFHFCDLYAFRNRNGI